MKRKRTIAWGKKKKIDSVSEKDRGRRKQKRGETKAKAFHIWGRERERNELLGYLKTSISEEKKKLIALRENIAMEGVRFVLWRLAFLVLVLFLDVSTATLSPTGVNYEGQSSSSSWSHLKIKM